MSNPDARVQPGGPAPCTVYLFNLVTAAARDWWARNVEEGPYLGCAPVVEHRYVDPIVEGMRRDGLEVR